MARESISKKTRFEIFKRDGFSCQYCGSSPPDATLEIDHVHPVSKGGSNSIDNLLTACFDCNRGKSDRLLQVAPDSVAEKAERLAERREQLKAFERLQRAERKRQDKVVAELEDVFRAYNPGREFTDKFRNDIRRHFIPKLSAFQMIDAMEIALTRVRDRPSDAIKYFCGICWSKIRGD